jgi:hypothetical protein
VVPKAHKVNVAQQVLQVLSEHKALKALKARKGSVDYKANVAHKARKGQQGLLENFKANISPDHSMGKGPLWSTISACGSPGRTPIVFLMRLVGIGN